MWNKLAHLVKSRTQDGDGDRNNNNSNNNDDERAATPDASNASAAMNGSVMSRVYEQHPNLSMFHSGSAVHLAAPSPPASPSKGSRRSMFKRSLKAKLTSTPAPQANSAASGDLLSPASSVWTSPSPVKLIPKKLRASLQIDTFTAQTTKTAPAPGSAPLPAQPHTPTFPEEHGDSAPNPTFNPTLDFQPSGTGSIRSILRDRNTPGTGQSVRFFSRDAYRVISPNVSAEMVQDAITGLDQEAFLEKLRNVSPQASAYDLGEGATTYHSAAASPPDNVIDMFSPPRQGAAAKSRKPLPFQPRHPSHKHSSSHSQTRSDSGSMSPSTSQSLSSLMIPAPPSDMSNLFDVSQEHELAEIPVSEEGSLRDDAVEEVEHDREGANVPSVCETSVNTIGRNGEPTIFPSVTATPPRDQSPAPPRSILSPEGTVFSSAMDTVRAQGRTPSRSFPGGVNDRNNITMFFTPEVSQATIDNKTAYFTPAAAPPASPHDKQLARAPGEMAAFVPPHDRAPGEIVAFVPPHDRAPGEIVAFVPPHDRAHGALVASLRDQLALQQQLAAQFEVDLAARDELVALLSAQLQEAETGAEKYRKEVARRQSAMRALRRKVGELEKICRGLEEEVERSREESFERSVMDEASEGALVVLHGSIGQLKGEVEKAKDAEIKLREECDALKRAVERLEGERAEQDDVERELRDAAEGKLAEMQALEDKLAAIESQAQDKLVELQQENERIVDEERERHRVAESQWSEERASLVFRVEARASDEDTRDAELADLRRKIGEKEGEVALLKAEVEVQWGHAEKADERIKGLEGEKEALAKSVEALHDRVEEMGVDWKEGELKRVELEGELNDAWAAKEEIEHERDQLVEDVNFEREHVEELTQLAQERDAKLDELEQERRYATDNVARLEELLRARDAESAQAQSQIIEREREAEQLRAQMHKMKREHGRFVDEQGRTLDETIQMEEASRRQMEDMVRQKAENEVAMGSMKERLGILADDTERLRRQVHELQQESADKDMKLLQLTKARAQDKEDKEGLNIALDSKQQELELLKRKVGVKGTGGSTPAPNRVGLPDLASRRQSVAFATPSVPRPRPSSVSIPRTPRADTPSKPHLGASLRGNSVSNSVAPPSTVKPARAGTMGPPASKGSSLSVASLSASTSSLARSTSTRPHSALPISRHRRSSSVMSTTSTALSDEGEKENAAPAKARKRASMVPA